MVPLRSAAHNYWRYLIRGLVCTYYRRSKRIFIFKEKPSYWHSDFIVFLCTRSLVSCRPKGRGKQNTSSVEGQWHTHWVELLIFHTPFISIWKLFPVVYVFCWEIRLQRLSFETTLYSWVFISCKNFMLRGKNSEGCFSSHSASLLPVSF